jgi:hypothetical protein
MWNKNSESYFLGILENLKVNANDIWASFTNVRKFRDKINLREEQVYWSVSEQSIVRKSKNLLNIILKKRSIM